MRLIAASLALLPSTAFAQDLALTSETSDASLHNGDIIVTATRREASLQEVPIAVSALSGETLASAGVTSTQQLTQVAPSLLFTQSSTNFQPKIRGVGSSGTAVGDESNVAVYIDGVYQPELQASGFDLLQISRIEVLRGPQGTLFGRNATGGLINVITPDPRREFAANVLLRYGRFNEKSARAYITGPLTDHVSADLSLLGYDDDGYVRNILTSGRIAARWSVSARSKILFETSDTSRITLVLDYSKSNDNTANVTTPIHGNSVGVSTSPRFASRPYEWAASITPVGKLERYGASIQTSTELDPFDLATTSSYSRSVFMGGTDSDATPARVAEVYNTNRVETITQEFRLTSKSESRLNWIFGAFGYYSTGRYDPIVTVSYIGGNRQPLNPIYSRNRTSSVAVFAEATYDILPALYLTAGLRYTYEQRRFNARNNTTSVRAQASFSNLTPRAILQYRFSDDANMYASYSRGFKSGVFNTAALLTVPVRPEVLDAYEVGVKLSPAHWITTNFAAFYYDYQDIQISARDSSGIQRLQNAATATMKGVEAEITARFTSNFSLRANATYLDAKYDSFPGALVTSPRPTGPGNVQSFVDAAGNDIPRTPRLTFNIGASYAYETGAGTIGVNANLYHTASYFWDTLNAERLKQPAYALLNGELSWTTPDDRFRFAIWGENLLNETVILSLFTSANADYASYQRPRRYGVSFAANF